MEVVYGEGGLLRGLAVAPWSTGAIRRKKRWVLGKRARWWMDGRTEWVKGRDLRMPCRVSSLAPSLQGVWGADVSRLLVADLHEKRIKNRVATDALLAGPIQSSMRCVTSGPGRPSCRLGWLTCHHSNLKAPKRQSRSEAA